MLEFDYDFLGGTKTWDKWERIGVRRRAGVMCPLFSIYSKDSVGIGEFRDTKLLVDWCLKTGVPIIQLLPLNDTGYGFSPYSAQSSFALETVYISLDDISGLSRSFQDEINLLRKEFPADTKTVDYRIKGRKMEILWEMFNHFDSEDSGFLEFKKDNRSWLDEYCEYKVLKGMNKEKSWVDWPRKYREKESRAMDEVRINMAQHIDFHAWVQWQAYKQFKEAHEYANAKGVYIMGDIPFLVARDSADVWGRYRDVFKLEFSAGTPPDPANAQGQKWGMPTYDWDILRTQRYDYFKQKLKYAENFYDMFRIDHVIGIFRLWSIPTECPTGEDGFFDPANESMWESNGRDVLGAMIEATTMLPVAEDLGAIPWQCPKVLEEMGIVGTDIQRWLKDRNGEIYSFIEMSAVRPSGCMLASGHDTSNIAAYWDYEAGTVDEAVFRKSCEEKEIDFNNIKDMLFNKNLSKYGRLRWNKDIIDVSMLLNIIEKREDESLDIINAYKETYNEKEMLWDKLGMNGEFKEAWDSEVILKFTELIASAASIFAIHSILDIVLIEHEVEDVWNFRINFPGGRVEDNWRLRLPLALEELLDMQGNKQLLEINMKTNRK